MTVPAPIIGIVGGIGSGKSVVADAFKKHGGYLIAADRLGHEALKDPEIHARVTSRWGRDILDSQGDVDRRKIAAIVFADRQELRALEAIVFPFIERRIQEEIGKAHTDPDVKFIILDAAIMLESGWHRYCCKVVFVDAPRPLRLARLQEKRGWDEESVTRREQAQMALDEKKRRADTVIINDKDFEKVDRQVQDTLERWNIIC